jgi:hypothetical protein
MPNPSTLELAYAYKESEIGPDVGVLYRLGTALRQATTPDKTGLSLVDSVAIKRGYKPSNLVKEEVNKIRAEYTTFRKKIHYSDMTVDSIGLLLEKMRKYPIAFEKGIKDLEGCLEQKGRDALKTSW